MSDSEDLITLLYDAVFGRAPDAAGLAWWSKAVDDGLPARDLIRALASGTESNLAAGGRRFFSRPESMTSWWQSELAEATDGLVVTDIGAAPLQYEDDIYRYLLRLPNARLTCFEPSPRRAEEVRAKHPGADVVESCVADGTARQFFETHAGVTSSLYRPNQCAAADLFEVGNEMEIAETYEVETVRLDDVAEAAGTHFLKLDVQAAERDVLNNAGGVLATTLAVHTELEFYPLYDDQPLGWQVWRALDHAGFDLYWFSHLQPYRMRSTFDPMGLRPRRLGWGDAVFFPKPAKVLELSVGDTLKLCAIWHDVYQAKDHCQWLLEHHSSRQVRAYGPAYRNLVQHPTQTVSA